jgi:TetR/AcrR family transcriptional regulator, transcriptional repressor of aconitase
MTIKRMSGDSRRRQILDAAKQCFAEYGFAGTTTKKVAAAAGISEGLLFRHFPTKVALHTEILVEACEADPDLRRLLTLEPSTATLVRLVREMVGHFLAIRTMANREKAERLRLTTSSLLEDGGFARELYEKIGSLFAPLFEMSLERAVEAGDAVRLGTEPIGLFWFTHHLLHTVMLTRLPPQQAVNYPPDHVLARQLSEFVLLGMGLTLPLISQHLDHHDQTTKPSSEFISESA